VVSHSVDMNPYLDITLPSHAPVRLARRATGARRFFAQGARRGGAHEGADGRLTRSSPRPPVRRVPPPSPTRRSVALRVATWGGSRPPPKRRPGHGVRTVPCFCEQPSRTFNRLIPPRSHHHATRAADEVVTSLGAAKGRVGATLPRVYNARIHSLKHGPAACASPTCPSRNGGGKARQLAKVACRNGCRAGRAMRGEDVCIIRTTAHTTGRPSEVGTGCRLTAPFPLQCGEGGRRSTGNWIATASVCGMPLHLHL